MDADERKRLSENMRVAATNMNNVLTHLDKGGQ
jgi:hypothetical protein